MIRVCKMAIGPHGAFKILATLPFDSLEDAEYYAKSQSALDHKHSYDVQQQEDNSNTFTTVHSYVDGKED